MFKWREKHIETRTAAAIPIHGIMIAFEVIPLSVPIIKVVILIDCMPSLGMLTINALASVDAVIIPVQAAYLPVKGLEQLIRTIGKVRRQLNKQLKIGGILITMVDNRTNYARDISDLIFDTYGNQIKIFPQSIPFSVRAAEISAEGISIFEHDPKGKVAAAYWQMTQEVLLDER